MFGGRHRGEMLDAERVFGEHGFCERLFEPSSVWPEHLFDVNTDTRFLHRPRTGPEIAQLQTTIVALRDELDRQRSAHEQAENRLSDLEKKVQELEDEASTLRKQNADAEQVQKSVKQKCWLKVELQTS